MSKRPHLYLVDPAERKPDPDPDSAEPKTRRVQDMTYDELLGELPLQKALKEVKRRQKKARLAVLGDRAIRAFRADEGRKNER